MIPALHEEGYEVLALTREKSRKKLPWSCTPVIGDALDGATYSRVVEGVDAFVQLVGVAHPSPAKATQFREIDLKAGMEAIRIADEVQVPHFIYVSVAHPAPVMQSYVAVRRECEKAIAERALNATILRPWYVLGPGHWWPYCVLPLYKAAELIPQTRESTRRLGFVTIGQMIVALVRAVKEPAEGIRVWEVGEIRRSANMRASVERETTVNR